MKNKLSHLGLVFVSADILLLLVFLFVGFMAKGFNTCMQGPCFVEKIISYIIILPFMPWIFISDIIFDDNRQLQALVLIPSMLINIFLSYYFGKFIEKKLK